MLAIFLVLTLVVLIFFGLGSVIGVSLNELSNKIPAYKENLSEMTELVAQKLESAGFAIGEGQIREKIDASKILKYTTDFISALGNAMSQSLLIILITIFMLAETFSIGKKVQKLEQAYGKSFQYLDEIGSSIRHYLSLKTVVSLLTGILITLWLLVLGVDYAVLWGIVAFLFNYIPNIGSILAAIPTMVLALLQLGLPGVIWTGVAYLVINLIMGNIIEPRVMGKGLGLSTLVVFLSLIIWGSIFGTVGMLLSVPLTLSFKIILEKSENTKWIALLLGADDEDLSFNETEN